MKAKKVALSNLKLINATFINSLSHSASAVISTDVVIFI